MNPNKFIGFYFLFHLLLDVLHGFFQCDHSMRIMLRCENALWTDIGCITVETIIQSNLIMNFTTIFLYIWFFLRWFWFRWLRYFIFLLVFMIVPLSGRLKMCNSLFIKFSLHQTYLTYKWISTSIQSIDLSRTTNT